MIVDGGNRNERRAYECCRVTVAAFSLPSPPMKEINYINLFNAGSRRHAYQDIFGWKLLRILRLKIILHLSPQETRNSLMGIYFIVQMSSKSAPSHCLQWQRPVIIFITLSSQPRECYEANLYLARTSFCSKRRVSSTNTCQRKRLRRRLVILSPRNYRTKRRWKTLTLKRLVALFDNLLFLWNANLRGQPGCISHSMIAFSN